MMQQRKSRVTQSDRRQGAASLKQGLAGKGRERVQTQRERARGAGGEGDSRPKVGCCWMSRMVGWTCVVYESARARVRQLLAAVRVTVAAPLLLQHEEQQ